VYVQINFIRVDGVDGDSRVLQHTLAPLDLQALADRDRLGARKPRPSTVGLDGAERIHGAVTARASCAQTHAHTAHADTPPRALHRRRGSREPRGPASAQLPPESEATGTAAMESKVAALEALVVNMGAQMAAMQGAHGAQVAAMQARLEDMEANAAVVAAPLAATASGYHAVLLSPDLFGELFPWLDRTSKAALRCVSRAMRSQVDGSIKVVASPASGFSPDSLTAALVRWPAVRDLTLLAVTGAASWHAQASLQPLATASLAGLTSLTVRQVGTTHGRACMGVWRAYGRTLARMQPSQCL
jgi:hypothetical protein